MTSKSKFDSIESISVEFQYELGHKIQVKTSVNRMIDAIRTMGAMGCTPGGIPQGGFRFKREQHEGFDWSLIGARPWTNSEGEEGVWYENEFYKKRVLEAVDSKKMKMPEAIKYSRGARPTDPDHIKEGEDGGVQYVTLAMFRGPGPARAAWKINSENPTQPR